MRNLTIAMIIAAFIMAASPVSAKGDAGTGLKYSWASRSIEGEFWGMAQGDIDRDGTVDTVLMERGRLRVGVLGAKRFEQAFECSWPTAAKAARVYLFDVDGDGDLEAALSAVEEGRPSSLVLDVDVASGACSEIVSRARFSLRVIDDPAEGPRLVGQGWSGAQFFSGAVREITLRKGSLKGGAKLNLPRNTKLYQFCLLPEIDGRPAVALLKGYSHLEVRRNVRGRKWKRVWRSGQNLGGSSNVLPAEQRDVLDQAEGEFAVFDIAPATVGDLVYSIRSDMPAREVIGAKPYVRGGEAVGFEPDAALGFTESWRTQWLPGAIVDFSMSSGDAQKNALTVLMQEDVSAFGKSMQAKILGFELPPPALEPKAE